ncbi:MAG TPA: alpha/beta hydrolase [Allosphingosinicella sp.]|nr:alpha/beta hydrolase [Allosphingosinicella sp.]
MKHFTASDGARIAYSDEGEGRPLVLLHGLMANSGFFDRQRQLADAFRVIALDLRGHGRSPAGPARPTIRRIAEDVTGLARHLDLGGAVGIGWSLGAAVLWRVLAGPASERFAAAVVIDMTPRVLNDGDWDLGLSRETCEARSQAIRDDFPAFAAAAGQAIFAAPGAEADRAALDFAANDPAAIGALWESLVEEDFRPLLPSIRQPTLVAHGAHSHLYGADTAGHLVAALPRARAVTFESSGHAPHLEQPELFNAVLREFAADLPPVRQTRQLLDQE